MPLAPKEAYMFVAEGLKPDIDNEGWVKGWGSS
jgi:hypothetical protein